MAAPRFCQMTGAGPPQLQRVSALEKTSSPKQLVFLPLFPLSLRAPLGALPRRPGVLASLVGPRLSCRPPSPLLFGFSASYLRLAPRRPTPPLVQVSKMRSL